MDKPDTKDNNKCKTKAKEQESHFCETAIGTWF
jgi:hypothetical protein